MNKRANIPATPLMERVQEALDASGLSASKASEDAGLGRRFITDLLDGSKLSISVDKAEKLAKVFGCDPAWLAFGTGMRTPQPEAEIVSVWNSILDPKKRRIWIETGKAMSDKSESN